MTSIGPFERVTGITFGGPKEWHLYTLLRREFDRRLGSEFGYAKDTFSAEYHFKIGYRIGERFEDQHVMVDHEVYPPIYGTGEILYGPGGYSSYNNYPNVLPVSDPAVYAQLEVKNGHSEIGGVVTTDIFIPNPYHPVPENDLYQFEFPHQSGVSQRYFDPQVSNDDSDADIFVSPVGVFYDAPAPVLSLSPPWVYVDYRYSWEATYPHTQYSTHEVTVVEAWNLIKRIDKWSLTDGTAEYLPE